MREVQRTTGREFYKLLSAMRHKADYDTTLPCRRADGGGSMAELTPLERAQQRAATKSCPVCEDRIQIRGASYCRIDGKMLHPMLLDTQYPNRCPIELAEERRR